MTETRRVLFVTPNYESNSLGRTYALWLLASHLGYESKVVSGLGARIWSPLADNDFAGDCLPILRGTSPSERAADLRHIAQDFDVVVAIKGLPESYGLALEAVDRTRQVFILDYDDPDLDIWLPKYAGLLRWTYRLLRQPKTVFRAASLSRAMKKEPRIITSNRVLHDRHGGEIIPHARPVVQAGAPHVSSSPRVCFVGTARPHKGIPELRAAVAQLADKGYSLVVTDDAPDDAMPHEVWLGNVPFERGQELVAEADIVALPSRDGVFARGQLPAKLLDAMMLGRAVISSDLGPCRWALDATGLLTPMSNVPALTAALLQFQDPKERARFGQAARDRAVESFSVESLAPIFSLLCERDNKAVT